MNNGHSERLDQVERILAEVFASFQKSAVQRQQILAVLQRTAERQDAITAKHEEIAARHEELAVSRRRLF